MGEQVTCPWCGKRTTPKLEVKDEANGRVKERRCSECNKVLAAYLDGEGGFLNAVRKFKN